MSIWTGYYHILTSLNINLTQFLFPEMCSHFPGQSHTDCPLSDIYLCSFLTVLLFILQSYLKHSLTLFLDLFDFSVFSFHLSYLSSHVQPRYVSIQSFPRVWKGIPGHLTAVTFAWSPIYLSFILGWFSSKPLSFWVHLTQFQVSFASMILVFY